MKFNIIDEYGKNIECDIIGTLVRDNKKFIVYTDGTLDNNEKEVYASLYEVRGDNLFLLPITDDEDWDFIDLYLEGV